MIWAALAICLLALTAAVAANWPATKAAPEPFVVTDGERDLYVGDDPFVAKRIYWLHEGSELWQGERLIRRWPERRDRV